MVVRDRGGGLGPLESNPQNRRSTRSEKDNHQIFVSDSGIMADSDDKDCAKCSRQCHKQGTDNTRASEAGSYGDLHSRSSEKVEQTLGFEEGRCRPYSQDVYTKELGKMKLRNGANGLLSLSKKKARVDLHLCYPSSSRLTDLSAAIENGEANGLDSNLQDLEGNFIDEDEQTKVADSENSLIPGLGDDVARLCLVRLSRSLYGSYYTVSKKFYELFKSGELYKARRDLGISEPWVYLLNSGPSVWRAFNPKDGGCWRALPPIPADDCFFMCDKESLTAGTQLLVIGREIQGLVVWIYDLVSDSWFRGPQMITPRCLYASVSWGEYGFVAGGVDSSLRVTNSAERYNSSTEKWEPLPPMLKKRKLCSGFCMDGKFWVIGGIDEKETVLTCGEEYDPTTKTWAPIRDMFPRTDDTLLKAPPLVAVVENQLYALDVCVNQLKLYCKKSNTWKLLGDVPVRADFNNGYGLAFKALDGQLLLIGGYCPPGNRDGDAIYAWKPSSDEGPPDWRFVAALAPPGAFVFNCAVMSA